MIELTDLDDILVILGLGFIVATAIVGGNLWMIRRRRWPSA